MQLSLGINISKEEMYGDVNWSSLCKTLQEMNLTYTLWRFM